MIPRRLQHPWRNAAGAARRSGPTAALAGLAIVVLGIQLAILLVRSQHQYRAFNLSVDFALFFQAWHQIAHGHLNPYLSPYAVSFWRSHFELFMWPLAPLYWLNRADGRTLLYLQDLAIVGAEAIGFAWVVAAARRARLPAVGVWCAAIAVLTLFVADPWLYRAATEDFHFEALAACFALAAGFELWRGNTRRAWVWVVITLLCGDVAGTYIAGVGLAFALTAPARRRQGLALAVVGVGWVGLIAAIGANKGSAIAGYAYLAGVAVLPAGARGVGQVVKGVVLHPSRPIHEITRRWSAIGRNLAPTGWIGVIGPFTFGVVLVVLLQNVLNSAPNFIGAPFQNVPVFLFGTTGTVLLVIAVARAGARRRLLAGVLLVASVASALVFDVNHRHQLTPYRVPAAVSTQLDLVRAHVPADAEVVGSFGVVGRFAGRRWIYAMAMPGQSIPIRSRTVVFVIAPNGGNQPLPPAVISATWAQITSLPSVKTLATGPDVYSAVWSPPPGAAPFVIAPAT